MPAKTFVDTGILVYAYDRDGGEKRVRSRSLLIDLWNKRLGVLSVQVLEEFYRHVTETIPVPLTAATARRIIAGYQTWSVQPLLPQTILRTSEIQERYLLTYEEARIVASASQGEANEIVSERFGGERLLEGIRIHDPFQPGSPVD